ncbi:hypothetical protein HDU98_003050 [Podochytrium sp. JEL0797]|nr:hypothetical protein HDU98_003050 [Podochytrium sp. JEL0797]
MPRALCFGNRGYVTMTSWKPMEGPHAPPLQGDSSDDFDWLNPLGAPIPNGSIPTGSIVLVGFTPCLTGANGRSLTLHPQWITILQRPPQATTSSTSASSSCTPSPKKKLKTWTSRAD